MPKFGQASLKQRETLCKELQDILDEAILLFDFSILEGFRDEEAQNRAYARRLSQVKWPNGKHNKNPSDAVDIAPYPIDWGNDPEKAEAARQRFCYLAGFIMSIAIKKRIDLRWGGDWDGDRDTRDEKFRDLGHFEVIRQHGITPVSE